MFSDAGQWAALRAYTTLAVNYRLRGMPLQQAINQAAQEAIHVGRGFEHHFAAAMQTIDASATPVESAPVDNRDAAGHGARWPNGQPPGIDPNTPIPPPNGAS